MSRAPLMPKATAVWLVENTALTFRQIADFCGLHELEVKGIADGDVAQGIKGLDPVTGGQLTREEITASVHYVHFRLDPDQVERFAAGPVALAITHPAYEHETVLAEATRESLLVDLRDGG